MPPKKPERLEQRPIRLLNAEWDALIRIAHSNGSSASAEARRLIQAFIDRHEDEDGEGREEGK